jgi:hypothetical protein
MALLAIWQDSKGLGTCRSCGAKVEWAELTSGRRMPFDPPIVAVRSQGSVLDGRVIEMVDSAVSISHFATCPDANKWRKNR